MLEVAGTIKSQTGYINLLVNNSGITGAANTDQPKQPTVKEFAEYYWNLASVEEFTRVFEVNVTGVFYTTLAFLELLAAGNEEGRGLKGVSSQIITISSVSGYKRYALSDRHGIFQKCHLDIKE